MMRETETPTKENMTTVKEKYLINPVFDFVNNSEEMEIHRNEIKVMQATTGFGKTHFIVNEFTPFLANEHNVRFILFCAPNTEALNHTEFRRMCNKEENLIWAGDNIELVERDLIDFPNKTVVMSATHQRNLVTGENSERITKILETVNSAVIADEIHTWSVPSPDLYHKVIGQKNPEYRAILWARFSEWMSLTPYIFGCTATVNRVMKDEFAEDHGKQFHVMNDWCPVEEMIFKQAWLGKSRIYNTSDWFVEFKDFFKRRIAQEMEIMRLGKEYNIPVEHKMISVVQAKTNTKRSNAKFEEICRRIETHILNTPLKRYINFPQIAVLTGKVKGTYHNGTFTKYKTDEEVLELCRNQENKIRFLVIVNKGTTGINIENIGGIFGFRERDTEDKEDNISLCEFALQFFGRTVRIFTGMKDVTMSSDRHGYGLETFLETASEGQKRILLAANRYDIIVPETNMYRKAMTDWTYAYANTIEAAERALFSETKTKTVEVHECENGVECPTCGKPGFLPNLEDVFEKVLVN